MVLKVGVVGLGVGRSHVTGYRANLNSKITALCDANPVRLNEIGDEFGIPEEARYTQVEHMLEAGDLDLVSVCLPNALHADVSIACLNRGSHVLCEKPLATTVADAQRMLDAAQQAERRLMVTYNWRYRADSQWMYQVVQSGQLGDIYHVNVSWRRETGIPGWGLFGDRAMSGGGALIDLGVHVLDLGLWMLGFPAVKTVSGDARSLFGPRGRKIWARRGAQTTPSFDVDDGAVGFLRLENGASMIVQASWAEHTRPQEDRIRVELQGTEGTAIMNIENYHKEDTLRVYTEIEGGPVTIVPSLNWSAESPHTLLIADLVDAVMAERPSPTDGVQGLMAVQVLEALYRSAAEGHEIALLPGPQPV